MSQRIELLNAWLKQLFKTDEYELKPASEDASFRSYYRLYLHTDTFIIMDAPPEYEKPELFVHISNKLISAGVNVPAIHASNIEQGFLLLTDFGDELYLDKLDVETADKLYLDAIRTLVLIQSCADVSDLAAYNEDLLRQEIKLFTDWLVAEHLRTKLTQEQTETCRQVTELLIDNALQQPQVFVHRDYHSRNLMLTKQQSPGVIDYQDAVLGPITYDPVSLLKDCYIKWPDEQINAWLQQYINEFSSHHPDIIIDKDKFQRWFDLMGVQRHLKASGIFARLSYRDNKHGFLKDIPRTLSYIVDLEARYPELSALSLLINESILPELKIRQSSCGQ